MYSPSAEKFYHQTENTCHPPTHLQQRSRQLCISHPSTPSTMTTAMSNITINDWYVGYVPCVAHQSSASWASYKDKTPGIMSKVYYISSDFRQHHYGSAQHSAMQSFRAAW